MQSKIGIRQASCASLRIPEQLIAIASYNTQWLLKLKLF